MKEFIIFVCIDSTEIFFSKLRSAGLNYNLPSFFTESYCAGVSNKHCLLTFFILAHLSWRLIDELILYQRLCLSTFSSISFEIIDPIELKFHIKTPLDVT